MAGFDAYSVKQHGSQMTVPILDLTQLVTITTIRAEELPMQEGTIEGR
jgi:hypothetical protein